MEYRIDYTITRRADDGGDFTEIGFGSSGTSYSPEHAAHLLQSAIEHREWETTDGMPDPDAA